MEPKHQKLLTPAELSEFLSVHVSTVRYWLKTGKVKGYGQGRIIRFDRNEVLQALDQDARNIGQKYRSLKNRLGQKAP